MERSFHQAEEGEGGGGNVPLLCWRPVLGEGGVGGGGGAVVCVLVCVVFLCFSVFQCVSVCDFFIVIMVLQL